MAAAAASGSPAVGRGDGAGTAQVTVATDFGTPMFDRLRHHGIAPCLLGIQYRCHPVIGSLASALFYGGRVRNGVTGEERPPLVPHLPPLALFDVAHGSER